MNKGNILLISIVLMLVISACTTYQYKPYAPEETGNTGLEESGENVGESTGDVVQEKQSDITVFEGDLIDLQPIVVDPDGDEVTIGYTQPFDEEGKWQTEEGDAGTYSVIVTATDNKESFVTKQIIVRVLSRNKPPVINIPDTLEFNEGDLIVLSSEITDVDDAEVFVTYSGWKKSKMYQTTYEDAGTYTMTITAADEVNTVSKDVTIIVKDVDRKPEISFEGAELPEKVTVTEGELIELKAEASDPEGENLTLTYSEPFDEEGKWQTERGDAGTYTLEITASDGTNEVVKEVEIEVLRKNQPPVIDSLTVDPDSIVLKKPGDKVTVKLIVVASDSDDDELEISYSGFMDAAEKTVDYGEKGGLKTVTVTVSDGKEEVSQDISFSMNNWPCFDCQQ